MHTIRKLLAGLFIIVVILIGGILIATRLPQRMPKYASSLSDSTFEQAAEAGFDAEGQ